MSETENQNHAAEGVDHTMDDAARVRELLRQASDWNEKARQNRIEAGRLLSQLRCNGGDWRRGTGCSAENAQRLIQLYTGEG